MPVDFRVTRETVANRPQANKLISEIDAQYFLADFNYYINSIIEYEVSRGIEIVIPPKNSRKRNESIEKKSTRTVMILRKVF